MCTLNAGIKKYKPIIKKKKKKNNSIVLLAKAKLNIEILIFKASVNLYINHDEIALVNNVLRENQKS